MIIKTYELDKIKKTNANIFLFYGENEGLKNEVIRNYFNHYLKEKKERYEENEILNNFENFISGLMNKSFFEDKKLIIVYRSTEKILRLVTEILEKKISDITLLINADNLEKKSKLRNFFEKEKNVICVPFYSDDFKTLNLIANNFFKKNNISISQEAINIILDRASGDRQNLNNELNKIFYYLKGKSKIDIEEVLKLTNLAENYSIAELVDNCLSKNLNKTIKILNENNFSLDDCILILRTMISKTKRLIKIKKELENKKNIDEVIYALKPPIFWKDKAIVKQQELNWTIKYAEELLYQISEIEILVKKNTTNSLNILSNFILSKSKKYNF